MQNQIGLRQGKKAFYLFLCSILGMILFITIYQASGVLYVDLVKLGYIPELGLSYVFVYVCFLAAMMLGSWYGIWLGLHWYEIVYERGDSPWFHSFKARSSNGGPRSSAPSPSRAEQSPFSSRTNSGRWNLEDLLDDRPEPSPLNVRNVEVSSKRPRKAPPAGRTARPRRPDNNIDQAI